MKFGSEEVAQYLKQHPQFFDEYADMLADIYVPHPHGGRAIPISELKTTFCRTNYVNWLNLVKKTMLLARRCIVCPSCFLPLLI